MGTCRPYSLKGDKQTYFYFTVDLGRGPDTGKRRQKKIRMHPETGVRWTTMRACEAAMHDAQAEHRKGAVIDPSRELVNDYFGRWLTETSVMRAPATNFGYRQDFKRIKPLLKDIRLRDLSALQLQRAYRQLRENGYAESTIHLTHTVVRAALRQAVKWRLLVVDPSDGVSVATPDPLPRLVWTAEETTRFLDSLTDDLDAALWRVLIDAELRVAEAIALTWDDVDLKAGTLAVRRTMTRDEDGRTIVGTRPKTRSSRRTIAIMPATVAALRAHRERQAARRKIADAIWHDVGIVFDRGDGRHTDRSVVQRRLALSCEAARVPVLTPHGLRHTSTTIMVTNGVPLKVVADRLGHHSTRITEAIYAHATTESDRRAAETLSRLLGQDSGNV